MPPPGHREEERWLIEGKETGLNVGHVQIKEGPLELHILGGLGSQQFPFIPASEIEPT